MLESLLQCFQSILFTNYILFLLFLFFLGRLRTLTPASTPFPYLFRCLPPIWIHKRIICVFFLSPLLLFLLLSLLRFQLTEPLFHLTSSILFYHTFLLLIILFGIESALFIHEIVIESCHACLSISGPFLVNLLFNFCD